MLKNNSLNIVKDIEYADHYKFSNDEINEILNEANSLNCKVITTEKDYLRIENTGLKEIKFIKTELKIIDENKLINTIL